MNARQHGRCANKPLARYLAADSIRQARHHRRPSADGVDLLSEARETLCRRVAELMLRCGAASSPRRRDDLRDSAATTALAWSLVDSRVTRARLQPRAFGSSS